MSRAWKITSRYPLLHVNRFWHRQSCYAKIYTEKMLEMKNQFDISDSIEIRKVDIAGVACISCGQPPTIETTYTVYILYCVCRRGTYMWSDTILSGPTDIGPPNTSHVRQTETPNIYEFRFCQKLKLVFRSPQTLALSKFTIESGKSNFTGFPQQVSLYIDWEV